MRRPWICLLVAGCGHSDPLAASPVPLPIAHDAAEAPCAVEPRTLPAGITHARVELAAHAATGGPACLDVVRIDLARFRPRLLTAIRDGAAHPAPAWRETFHLAAVINAGMFHDDGKPVGLVVEDGTSVSNDNAKYAGFLAFDPRSPSDPPAIITGRDCADFDLAQLRHRYRSILQSPRLLGCDGTALPWADPKQYSAAAVGIARDGSLVFLHARGAVKMTDLAAGLAKLDLAGALFMEGGPEASLIVDGDPPLQRVGSYETGFVENDGNSAFWWLPNVLGVQPR